METNWQSLIDENPCFSAEEYRAMEREWPYFVWPSLMELEQGDTDSKESQRLRSRIALAVGDRNALTRVLDPESDFTDFYPDMKPVQLSTNATIDAFLNRFGVQNEKETDLLTRLIFDSNVSETVAEKMLIEDSGEEAESAIPPMEIPLVEEEKPVAEASVLGDAEKEKKPVREAIVERQNTSPLSLSLAKMMIKNRNYAKALEIITRLNLENPEKSAYFADQIRFLKKLLVIQQHNNQ